MGRVDCDRTTKFCSIKGLKIEGEISDTITAALSKLIETFPEAKLLGLTATPERLDGRGLGKWFEHLIVGPDTRTLIDAGYLSKFKYFAPTIPDLRGVRVNKREYDPRDLEAAMSRHTLVGDVIDHYKRLTPNARALAFCVSVEAARKLAARFNKLSTDACRKTCKHSSSVASGRTKQRFSRIDPENNCASWVTNPIRSRRSSIAISSSGVPL